MGLLDDAIREHLELKRRAGSEVDDQTGDSSARDAPAQPWAGPADENFAQVDDLGDDHFAEDHFGEEDVVDHHEDPQYGVPLPAHPSAVPAVEPVAPPAPPPPASPVTSRPAPPTEEYQLPPSAAEPDVLEQTPDFLQETPEHDRLWFEQAPPQEFDFDK